MQDFSSHDERLNFLCAFMLRMSVGCINFSRPQAESMDNTFIKLFLGKVTVSLFYQFRKYMAASTMHSLHNSHVRPTIECWCFIFTILNFQTWESWKGCFWGKLYFVFCRLFETGVKLSVYRNSIVLSLQIFRWSPFCSLTISDI